MSMSSIVVVLVLTILMLSLAWILFQLWDKVKHAMIFLTQGGDVKLVDVKEIAVSYGTSTVQKASTVFDVMVIISGVLIVSDVTFLDNFFNSSLQKMLGAESIPVMVFVFSSIFVILLQVIVLGFTGRNMLLELNGYYNIGGYSRRKIFTQKVGMVSALIIIFVVLIVTAVSNVF